MRLSGLKLPFIRLVCVLKPVDPPPCLIAVREGTFRFLLATFIPRRYPAVQQTIFELGLLFFLSVGKPPNPLSYLLAVIEVPLRLFAAVLVPCCTKAVLFDTAFVPTLIPPNPSHNFHDCPSQQKIFPSADRSHILVHVTLACCIQ